MDVLDNILFSHLYKITDVFEAIIKSSGNTGVFSLRLNGVPYAITLNYEYSQIAI
jgi:hypothetical protein